MDVSLIRTLETGVDSALYADLPTTHLADHRDPPSLIEAEYLIPVKEILMRCQRQGIDNAPTDYTTDDGAVRVRTSNRIRDCATCNATRVGVRIRYRETDTPLPDGVYLYCISCVEDLVDEIEATIEGSEHRIIAHAV